MKRLENLPQIAQRQLGGLEASPAIWAKAKLEAADIRTPRRAAVLRPAAVLCAALVLCVGVFSALNATPDQPGEPAPVNVMDTHSAGSDAVSVQPRTLSDMPSGVISMSAGMRSSTDTLFAQLGSAAFPLVSVNGATYRLLTSPGAVSESLLGEAIGTVNEFNLEPALGSGGVVSNAVACGETVYAISGMNGALAAARVDGALRVFQRVSYAGVSIIGTETLQQTLCTPQDAVWIEVDGMGRVDDPAQVERLMQVLMEDSYFVSSGLTGEGSMQIGLQNGLTLQLLTGSDAVSACGTWNCPDFFEVFAQAVQ